MMERLRLWAERHRVLVLILNIWFAQIVLTWAQTKVFQNDNATTAATSRSRWLDTHKEWGVRLDKVEQACARR